MEIGSHWNGWRIESLIGEGSFGKVYKIVKEELGYEYDSALKVIRIPQSQSELASVKSQGMNEESVTMYFRSMVEELVSEFALMSKFKGTSNIVSYEDHVIEENKDSFGWTIFIRMELLTPMYDYLKDNKLSVRDVIKLGIDICQALELCQKYNIIHRDIKPENIFVSKFGDYKLGDFGIARQLEKTSSGMSKKGTYTYMAPEVYKGMSYNSTVDIYSLGIVLYSFLNNNRTPFLPPFPQTIRYTDKEKANILRMSGKELPKPQNAKGRLAEIVLKACSYNPSERYESAHEMRKALETVLYDESEAEFIYPNGNNILENGILTSKESECKDTDKQNPAANEKTTYLFREQAERAAREEAAQKAREEAERKARIEAEERARKAAAERAHREAEEKARREAEEKARRQAEEQARREAAERARREAEERARREAEERARREAEEKARKAEQERARQQAEEQARRKDEEKASRQAEEKAKREAAEKARIKAQEKARREAEEKTRRKEEKASNKAKKREARNNEDGKSKKKLILVCGALLAVIIGIIITVVSCNNAKYTIVPNVIGNTKQEAIKLLDASEIKYSFKYENSNTINEDCVIRQSEIADSKIEKGSTIILTISQGKKIIAPDLVGMTENEAKELLKKCNLKLLVEKRKYSDKIKKDKIISQGTKSGTVLQKGDTITVIVSKGVEMISVPNVVGLSKEDAKVKISNSKLKYKTAYEYSSSVAKGKVIKQNVSSGKKVKKNTTVTITVSKGKKPSSSSTVSYYENNDDNYGYEEPQTTEEVQTTEAAPEPEDNNSQSGDSDDDIIGMVID